VELLGRYAVSMQIRKTMLTVHKKAINNVNSQEKTTLPLLLMADHVDIIRLKPIQI
jgi:hypothetical protein